MQFFDLIVAQVTALAGNFQHPIFLWGIPILFVVLIAIITRSFVRYSLDDAGERRLRRMRLFVFIMRFIAMSLLCIALATPFTEVSKESDGNPHAVILVDKSSSMDLFDTGFVDQLTH